MSDRVQLVVVIPTHGRATLLGRTLSSLAECEFPASLREVIVVENGGREGAESVVGEFVGRLPVRYVYHDAGNKSEALNRVLEEVCERWIVFFDDDVRLAKTVLTAYAAAIAAGGRGHYYGGPVGVDYEEAPAEWIWLPPSAKGWEWTSAEPISERTLFLGFNWAAYSEDIRDLGGFDPEFGPGSPTGARGQESDIQMRLQVAGNGAAYVPDARVWHYVPKERCSERWSLARIRQHAIAVALREDENDKGPRLFRVPRWRLRRLVCFYANLWCRALIGNRRLHYLARVAVEKELGYLQGSRSIAQLKSNRKRAAASTGLEEGTAT